MLLTVVMALTMSFSLAFAHEEELDLEAGPMTCLKAPSKEVELVKDGLSKKDRFLKKCRRETGSNGWCDEIVRPNPDSKPIFECTYGTNQPHFLIHPDESTWQFAIDAVKLVKEIEEKGLEVCQIYNWWRPETYNKNVRGSATRHPFGTSVDVRFCTRVEQIKAHAVLCEIRAEGRLRALGDYGGTGLHLGVGDSVPNTWGKPCPRN